MPKICPLDPKYTASQKLMTRVDATQLVNGAIDAVVAAESLLLDLDISERALSHQLAHYMSMKVTSPLSVDCEYNRHFGNPKRLTLKKRQSSDREIRATTVYPDIVVHERNSNKRNYIVLEVKKPGEALDYDESKLRAFKSELGYLHTAHVILGRKSGIVVREIQWVD